MEWLIGIGVVVLIIVVIGFWVLGVYNELIQKRNRVKNSWSQIDVQLQRRFDLIPNLIETVKAFAKQEKDIFMAFAEARKMFASGQQHGSVGEISQANNMLGRAMTQLSVVVESYPQLKSDQNFLRMQADLKETEDKIALNRQFYNDVVLTYNNSREVFPASFVAGMFKFKEADLFKIDDVTRAAPKVSF
jgi:LemA protein